MKILFISDTHFGYDFELVYHTVKRILDTTKPDLVLSGGDWDFDRELISTHGVNWFSELFSGYTIYSILGNHDLESGDEDTIKIVMNLRNNDGSRVFFSGLIDFNGVKILGVPGLIGDVEELGYIKKTLLKYRNSEPDFLLMHDCPEWYLINIKNYVVNIVKPKNILCGHVHDESFKIKQESYYIESTDALCNDQFIKKNVNIIKVITTPPFTGYALFDYNPESGSINSITLGRVV